ncbi:MAG: glycoside hydrolase family 13 protein [Chloroflexi bacterium]|nr:glycoside hydrolase family 13 protein [Chloroflexota bacterium]
MSVDTPRWARDAVFYQIFPDRFAASERVPKPAAMEPWDSPPTVHGYKGGDLLGIAEHLDELADLGITALYLTPVFASASNHRYHTDDYWRVDPLLGGDGALRELLDQAHARDMRVVLDGVFNHCGRGFWRFHHVAEAGIHSPFLDWFHLDRERLAAGHPLVVYPGPEQEAEIHRLSHEGMGAGEASRRVLGFEGWWGLPALPKLNVQHPETRAYLLDVAERWLRFGIDGWRLDVADEIGGDFWSEFRARCRAVRPDAYLVGEVWYPKPEWLTGHQFDALMDYPLAEAILGYAAGDGLDLRVAGQHDEYRRHVVHRDGPSFAAELERLLSLYDPDVTAVMLNLLGSHDAPRMRTLMGDSVDAVRIATLLQMTLPGAPCVYYGDEIGMRGEQDPYNRGSFPWDRGAWDQDLRAYVRDAIGLRRRHAALRDGELRVVAAEGPVFAMARHAAGETFLVVTDPGDGPARIRVRLPDGWDITEPGVVELGGRRGGQVSMGPDGTLEVAVEARSGVVIAARGD